MNEQQSADYVPGRRPRLLDLFCCAGGAARGYQRAGFHVTGVDIVAQPNYCGDAFHQGDALEFLTSYWRDFDAVHTSPPCQPYSTGVVSRSSQWNHTRGKDEPALVGIVGGLLASLDVPWVIENVMGARPVMPGAPFVLCGSMFSRPIPRHRAFSTSWFAEAPEHPDCRGLAKRSATELGWDYRDMSVTGKGRRAGTSQRWAQLLGVDWPMTQHEMAESIPPAYTEFVGRQLLAQVEPEGAVA